MYNRRPTVTVTSPMTDDPQMSDPIRDATVEAGVRDTIARYAHHVDDERFVEFSELFTPDGELVIEVPGQEPIVLRGRAAIESYIADSTARRAADPALGRYRRHHVSSIMVSVESPTTATGTSYFMAVMAHGVDHWGQYWDRYAYDGRWRFEQRRVRVDGRVRRTGRGGEG